MPKSKSILIASDHAGVELKASLKRLLPDVSWEDLGPAKADRVDYPDYAEKLSRKIASGDAALGILICGSGIGMAISANKIHGIRAAVVESSYAARLSREHNDANVLCLGARLLAAEYAAEIVSTWLDASFEGGRHEGRVAKIKSLEERP